jgi:hypothetical protein
VKIDAAILRGINHSQIPALAGMGIDIPVTVSDSCAQGQREDISGQTIKDILLALLANSYLLCYHYRWSHRGRDSQKKMSP